MLPLFVIALLAATLRDGGMGDIETGDTPTCETLRVQRQVGVCLTAPETYELPRAIVTPETQVAQLATSARIVPAFKDGKIVGFRHFSIRPGSWWARLGVRNGDILLKVNGIPMTSPENALDAYRAMRETDRYDIELERDEGSLTKHITLTGSANDLLDEGESVRPPPVTPPPETVPCPKGAHAKKVSICQLGPNAFQVQRTELERALSHLAEVTGDAHWIPAFHEGKSQGMKIFGIRPSSSFGRLGLANGDILRRFDELPLTSPEAVLGLLEKLRATKQAQLEIERDGSILRLQYTVR